MRQKLSDYIVGFLASHGIRHVFVVSGGASIHIMHSLHQRNGIQPICPHHEQAGAMAADAYARVTGKLGCAAGTSGPGAMNMITGIAGAWFDSIPTLFLTGQVTTFRQKGDSGLRQFGFQETDIVPMVTPITKYSVQLRDPMRIRYELEKAVYIALSGRPGPVLIDIPDDLQRTFIETDNLVGFTQPPTVETPEPTAEEIEATLRFLKRAKRPVIILGHGVRLSGATAEAVALVERCDIPVLTSWGAKDILPGAHRLNAGVFGTHGTRAGNFIIQNADCVLAIGARLSTRETGSPLNSWAREARTIIVDIDPAELRKFARFERNLDLAINADAGKMITALRDAIAAAGNSGSLPDCSAWHKDVADWYQRYPVCPPDAWTESSINPYVFMEVLSKIVPDNANIFTDTGCAVAWSMQGFKVRGSQRTFHDFNNTAMGWALPASIAGALAQPDRPSVCLVGDGSLMMNIQELATLTYHRLPIKILLIDNGGYSMVRQTEQQWLGGVNVGTSTASGLGFPNFMSLAESFGLRAIELTRNSDLAEGLKSIFAQSGACLARIEVPSEKGVVPQVAFGYPIEDSEPHLPREEFLLNMKVSPMPVSLKPIGGN